MKVASFTVDHIRMKRGIFVSRKDPVGSDGAVTTFDLRMKEPNREPVMDTAVMHTLEHLMAVFLREHPTWAEHTLYVGPMGCRTGMYLLFKGDLSPQDIVPVIKELFEYIIDFKGEVPAARPEMCGNYLDNNLVMAQYEAHKFYHEVLCHLTEENLVYPQ